MTDHFTPEELDARCQRCGHAPHSTLDFCPNMASDNDCNCTVREASVTPDELSEDEMAAAFPRMREAFFREHEWRKDAQARSAALVKRIRELEQQSATCANQIEQLVSERDYRISEREDALAQLAQARAERDGLREGITKLADQWHERAYSGESIIDGMFNECEVELRALLGSGTPDTEGGQG